uniref:uncharacterized protein LOC118529743 n=1 Tax=Halichoerus grypus TaxID=9711 RepID=UPI0016593170|nr:uncharacterized protein LOC118529743 [Halichoerus grypus]
MDLKFSEKLTDSLLNTHKAGDFSANERELAAGTGVTLLLAIPCRLLSRQCHLCWGHCCGPRLRRRTLCSQSPLESSQSREGYGETVDSMLPIPTVPPPEDKSLIQWTFPHFSSPHSHSYYYITLDGNQNKASLAGFSAKPRDFISVLLSTCDVLLCKETFNLRPQPNRKLLCEETTDVGEDAEKGEPSYTVGGNASWYSHSENSM